MTDAENITAAAVFVAVGKRDSLAAVDDKNMDRQALETAAPEENRTPGLLPFDWPPAAAAVPVCCTHVSNLVRVLVVYILEESLMRVVET